MPHIKTIPVLILLFAVCALTYANSLGNPFLIDDYDMIVNSPFLHQPHSLLQLFIPDLSPQAHYYRPLTHVIPIACYIFTKGNPWMCHLLNLIFFIFACFSIYKLISILFNDHRLALCTSLLFAVHPLNGLLVNYVTASIFSIQIILLAWSIIFFLHYDRDTVGRFKKFSLRACREAKFSITSRLIPPPLAGGFARRIKHIFRHYCHYAKPASAYAVSIIFFFLALLCHETSLALPLYLISAMYLKDKNSLKSAIHKSLPYFLMAAPFLILRLFLSFQAKANAQPFEINMFQYTAAFTKLLTWYLSRFFMPDGIVLIWATSLTKGNIPLWNALLLVFLFFALVILEKRSSHKELFWALSWLIIGFTLVAIACLHGLAYGLLIEPHWLFFPSIAVFTMMIYFLLKLEKLLGRLACWLVALFLFGIFGISTYQLNNVWGDEEAYCRYWLKHVPHFVPAKNFLASYYIDHDRYGEAEPLLSDILTNDPQNDLAIYRLIQIALIKGNLDEAAQYIETALRLHPQSITFHKTAALIYTKKDNRERAQQYEQRARELESRSVHR